MSMSICIMQFNSMQIAACSLCLAKGREGEGRGNAGGGGGGGGGRGGERGHEGRGLGLRGKGCDEEGEGGGGVDSEVKSEIQMYKRQTNRRKHMHIFRVIPFIFIKL